MSHWHKSLPFFVTAILQFLVAYCIWQLTSDLNYLYGGLGVHPMKRRSALWVFSWCFLGCFPEPSGIPWLCQTSAVLWHPLTLPAQLLAAGMGDMAEVCGEQTLIWTGQRAAAKSRSPAWIGSAGSGNRRGGERAVPARRLPSRRGRVISRCGSLVGPWSSGSLIAIKNVATTSIFVGARYRCGFLCWVWKSWLPRSWFLSAAAAVHRALLAWVHRDGKLLFLSAYFLLLLGNQGENRNISISVALLGQLCLY